MDHQRNVTFLGYDDTKTSLIDALRQHDCAVTQISAPVRNLAGADLVISFGYRHILSKDVLATARRPILNLHISYLPFNRGAHPNFWSWIEGTPAGVTVHEIDAGIDTGPIVAQRKVTIDPRRLTFRQAHTMLVAEIEALFVETLPAILNGDYEASAQPERGTVHRQADLPVWFDDWDMPIDQAIARWKDEGEK